MSNLSLGAFGEKLAAEFLAKNGFEILARNVRCGKNEIDLVARKNGVISFVEVKTRRGAEFGHPAEAVTLAKQRELAKAAEHYLRKFPNQSELYRFDVIAITIAEKGAPDILFIEDAFRAM
ncbi:MAG: YraN family protein [Chloroherpetonaceae bacterium]|nr:YraN family protein [Chloroherpetonaceae bacterium]MDW8436949.1 YraN family protein [Chloroherpetonaceae bacterium]